MTLMIRIRTDFFDNKSVLFVSSACKNFVPNTYGVSTNRNYDQRMCFVRTRTTALEISAGVIAMTDRRSSVAFSYFIIFEKLSRKSGMRSLFRLFSFPVPAPCREEKGSGDEDHSAINSIQTVDKEHDHISVVFPLVNEGHSSAI
jgi:hypothetical protein